MAFPANPVYASKDFVNWKLASNAVNRVSQFPVIRSGTQGNGGGMFANTLRYHNGTFYLISTWASAELGGPRFVVFTTTDPHDDLAWSNAIWPQTPGYTIDPDIFFDDDGSVVVASAGEPIIAAYLDLTTGNTSEPWELWAGTGGQSAEGPHIYKRDGYYYLLIAEGGTQLNHSATMARSKSLKGPWEAAPRNPLVSNRGTAGHENTLRLTASRANLTTDPNFNTSTEGVTALFRRQEHTYFNFSVDIQLGFGKSSGDEMGISNFGTPDQHADLGIVYLEDVSESSGKLKPYLRVRARSVNAFTAPEPTTAPVPEGWLGDAIRLRISPRNESHYEFFASSVGQSGKEEAVGLYSTALLSGDGAGTGGVLGIYATTNGGSYPFEGYVSRWRYQPVAQQIGYNSTIFVPT
ncbi:Non-reducing end alpha-L-arabinofuranosidase [Colletotrichum fructicola]|nr:Non-reducing end alpha-L-arabinofuranosidase [Colletotrichum fructicola]